jgi:hypothetical protein
MIAKRAFEKIRADTAVGKVLNIIDTLIFRKNEEIQDNVRKSIEDLIVIGQEKIAPLRRTAKKVLFIIIILMGINTLLLTGIFFVLLFQ